MAKEEGMSVSIVIPSYNSMETIKCCLDSVLNQSTTTPYEVVLVDSSDDATPQIVRNEYETVKLIRLSHRTNPAQARNIGIRHAKGKVIALIDADCVAEEDWIEMIMKTHEREPSLIIGGPVKNFNRCNILGTAIYLIKFNEFFPKSPERLVSFIPTCNASYKRTVFDRFGDFPQEMWRSEDVLFHRRIAAQGEKILFSPAIQVSHVNGRRWQEFYRHLFEIGFWTARSRKQASFLKGAFLVKMRFLIPLLFFYKFGSIIGRCFRWDTKSLFFVVLFFPLVSLAILIWIYGFWKGTLSKPSR
jgi:glycosyltransferase involved in cell wall biosynthesis